MVYFNSPLSSSNYIYNADNQSTPSSGLNNEPACSSAVSHSTSPVNAMNTAHKAERKNNLSDYLQTVTNAVNRSMQHIHLALELATPSDADTGAAKIKDCIRQAANNLTFSHNESKFIYLFIKDLLSDHMKYGNGDKCIVTKLANEIISFVDLLGTTSTECNTINNKDKILPSDLETISKMTLSANNALGSVLESYEAVEILVEMET